MKRTITTEKIPIMLWLDTLEEEALQQARRLANLPCAFHHIAIMADAHVGYGMPIGGVLATIGAVIPNGVGVDIGCGMRAVRTGLTALEVPVLKKMLTALRAAVPLGFKHHKKSRPLEVMPDPTEFGQDLPVVTGEFENARRQIGTLGGGNHFIEIQQGNDQRIWLMVHSGSRNIGYRVAGHYNELAVRLAKQTGKDAIPREWQLATLPLDTEVGQRYLREMEYCVAFASANRSEMMAALQEIVTDLTGCDQFDDPIDVAHNYAALETHFFKEVWVHRKGATRAFAGEYGIIPGCQGSRSYIVKGLGNPLSFMSCSHGAGRVLGRKQAQRVLNLEEEREKLDKKRILHSLRHRRDLEEAPGAYKNIDEVIADQQDLIEIAVELQPLAVLKG
ncbi:RtcB family protein [Desulfobulbus oligotrophicus]|uniref:3'-phosphate/5'-hydroxy nucleic acid ligase n=1 Tax=Desulfobulbus oligotrophicus TaxID=1909699 RepID=A0A7T6AP74_9BACT|nr:RtcB family protein [Desulfobulbus oligotrophicus]MDY0391654.1 RtcB family protein [Desulfobulbus oligotrophicus]QQG64401.1 RtcB family protein [Desulfobulbus oligotrophicus]